MIRWGTSHFVNLKVAARYYAAYHNGDIDAGKAAAELSPLAHHTQSACRG